MISDMDAFDSWVRVSDGDWCIYLSRPVDANTSFVGVDVSVIATCGGGCNVCIGGGQ